MLYFDTSFVAPLLLEEATSTQIEAFLTRQLVGDLCISHWVRVEFASLIAREVRMGGLPETEALQAIVQFDQLVNESFRVLLPGPADYELARKYIQRFATKLRAGDALHLAIAHNQGAKMFYTLDEGLLDAARLLNVHADRGIKS